jgi:hypothetical protein
MGLFVKYQQVGKMMMTGESVHIHRINDIRLYYKFYLYIYVKSFIVVVIYSEIQENPILRFLSLPLLAMNTLVGGGTTKDQNGDWTMTFC